MNEDMLKDHIGKYYFDGNYNCAEALIHAANDYYGLGLDERAMKLVSGYGAGMQTGNVCGAVLSAISVISLKYVDTKAHESTAIKPVTEQFISRFSEASEESILCKELKAVYFQPEKRCLKTVLMACDALEQIIG